MKAITYSIKRLSLFVLVLFAFSFIAFGLPADHLHAQATPVPPEVYVKLYPLQSLGDVKYGALGSQITATQRDSDHGGGVYNPGPGTYWTDQYAPDIYAGIPIYRYPLGSFVRIYDWYQYIDMYGVYSNLRGHYPEYSGSVYDEFGYGHLFGLDEYIGYCGQAESALPMVQLSAHDRTYAWWHWEHVGDWPAFSGAASSNAYNFLDYVGNDVRFFEIDNETYNDQGEIWHESPNLPVGWCGTRAKDVNGRMACRECTSHQTCQSTFGPDWTCVDCLATFGYKCEGADYCCACLDPNCYRSGSTITYQQERCLASPLCQNFRQLGPWEYANIAADMMDQIRLYPLRFIAADSRAEHSLFDTKAVIDEFEDLGVKPDYLALHTYARRSGLPTCPQGAPDCVEAADRFRSLWAAPRQFEQMYADVRRIAAYSWGTDAKLANTEWDISDDYDLEPSTPYKNSLGEAMFIADMLGTMANPKNNVSIANHFLFMDWNPFDNITGAWGTVRRDANNFLAYRPNHKVFQMFDFGEWTNPNSKAIRLDTFSDTFDTGQEANIMPTVSIDVPVGTQSTVDIAINNLHTSCKYEGKVYFDDISIKADNDPSGAEKVLNGDFEAGFSNWTNTPFVSGITTGIELFQGDDAFYMEFSTGAQSYAGKMYHDPITLNPGRYYLTAQAMGSTNQGEEFDLDNCSNDLSYTWNQSGTACGTPTTYGGSNENLKVTMDFTDYECATSGCPSLLNLVWGIGTTDPVTCNRLYRNYDSSFSNLYSEGVRRFRIIGKILVKSCQLQGGSVEYECGHHNEYDCEVDRDAPDGNMVCPGDTGYIDCPYDNPLAGLAFGYKTDQPGSEEVLIHGPGVSKIECNGGSKDQFVEFEFEMPEFAPGVSIDSARIYPTIRDAHQGLYVDWHDISFTPIYTPTIDVTVTPQSGPPEYYSLPIKPIEVNGGWKEHRIQGTPYVSAYAVRKDNLFNIILVNKYYDWSSNPITLDLSFNPPGCRWEFVQRELKTYYAYIPLDRVKYLFGNNEDDAKPNEVLITEWEYIATIIGPQKTLTVTLDAPSVTQLLGALTCN